ncbi:MAG: hypothetical protein SNJ84_10535, partial [Verrucomicrobiia bacterium]
TPDQQELAQLCSCLRAAAPSRSLQHQQWAWTRLHANAANPATGPDFLSVRWFATGAAAALGLGLALFVLRPGAESPTTTTPTIMAKGDKLHAVPFHSKRANADVIWVDGYDYLPASYPLR